MSDWRTLGGLSCPTQGSVLLLPAQWSYPHPISQASTLGVLIHIFLMIGMFSIFSWAYWPFVYLLWRNVYSRGLPILKSGYLVLLLLSFKSSLYIQILTPHPINDLQSILYHSTDHLSLCWLCPWMNRSFPFWQKSKLSNLFWPEFLVSFSRNHCQIQCHTAYPYVFF